jgi:hypothetical protein
MQYHAPSLSLELFNSQKWLRSSPILQAIKKNRSLHTSLITANPCLLPKQAEIQFLILSNRHRNSSILSINWNKKIRKEKIQQPLPQQLSNLRKISSLSNNNNNNINRL